MDLQGFLFEHIFTVTVPAVIVIGVVVYKLEERRKERLRQAARALGLTPTNDSLETLPEGLLALPVFDVGSGHAVSGVFWGPDRDFFIAELTYSVGSGKSRTTLTQSVAAFHLRGRAIPPFSAAPETLMDKLSALIGGQDIDFDDDPEFSDVMRLTGTDEAAVRSFVNLGARRFLVGRPQWSVQGRGEWLMGFHHNRRAKPEGLKHFYADALALYATFLAG